MPRASLIAVVVLAGAGCASSESSLLDRELQSYRYEQERFRRGDLEKMYREEEQRSEQLSKDIVALREENRRQEEELARLKARLAELGAGISAARERVRAGEAATPEKEPDPAPSSP